MKIKLPAHFTDVTLREYIAWHEGSGQARMNVFVKDVHKMRLNAVNNTYSYLEDLMSNETPQFFHRIKIGEETYGFVNDWDAFTSGEWIDCESYAKELNTAHKLMSVLYRPVTRETKDTYEIKEYQGSKDSEKFLDLPASYFLGMVLFFCKKRSELLRTSERSLMEVLRAMTTTRDGAGTKLSSPSREMTSSRWTPLRSFLSSSFSRILRMLWIGRGKRTKGLDK